ncbi:hypothetical protein [Bradyrhizobium sp. NP1]|uniref:hypothetical protein n=1 Tax=Bradyrhizobium sp. NP1 TaxID=3049772 RepID=UPI0025A5A2A2|nr:hypothetical protein [Bradyrhizobium sp. NP1]WJR74922.1 hypothetical protein QOU61_19025 [Bradyrhizobium sp. NP1]
MRDLANELEHLFARQAAFEAVLTQIAVPLLVAAAPAMALELVEAMRADFHVRAPMPNDRLVLLTEEYIAALADQIERKVRMTMGADR